MAKFKEGVKQTKAAKFFSRLKVVGKRLVLCMKGDREVAAVIEKKPVMIESIVKTEPKVPAMVVGTQPQINDRFSPHFTTGFC